MEVTVNITYALLAKFYLLVLSTTTKMKLIFWFIALFFFIDFMSDNKPYRLDINMIGYVFLSLAIATGCILLSVIINLLFNFYRAKTTVGVLGIHNYLFTAEYIIEKTAYNETKSSWKFVKSIQVKSGMVGIYIDVGCHIIPKSSFKNEQEFEEFCKTIQDYWQDSQSDLSLQ